MRNEIVVGLDDCLVVLDLEWSGTPQPRPERAAAWPSNFIRQAPQEVVTICVPPPR
jgi:hypothetical protein